MRLSVSLPILAALLALAFVPAPAAAADETCLVQIETHDWQRQSACASVKGDCKAYWKYEGVREGTECMYGAPATANVAAIQRCEVVLVGPDIEQGFCVDTTRADCKAWWYERYPGPYAETCLVPGFAIQRIQRCEVLIMGPDIENGACVDSARADCKAWYYTRGPGPYRETCLVPGVTATSAGALRG